jgi:hypothetical protein
LTNGTELTSISNNREDATHYKPHKPAERDESGNPIFDLSGKKKVRLTRFHGMTLIDIREFYSENGELKPGKKGVCLTEQQWMRLKAQWEDIDFELSN